MSNIEEFNKELNEKLTSFDDGEWTNKSYNTDEGTIMFFIENRKKDLVSKINLDKNVSVDKLLGLVSMSV